MELPTTLHELFVLVSILFAPWVLLSLISTITDVSIGFIDEWLLLKLRGRGRSAGSVIG